MGNSVLVVFCDYIIIMKLHFVEVHSGITKLFIAITTRKTMIFFSQITQNIFFKLGYLSPFSFPLVFR